MPSMEAEAEAYVEAWKTRRLAIERGSWAAWRAQTHNRYAIEAQCAGRCSPAVLDSEPRALLPPPTSPPNASRQLASPLSPAFKLLRR